MLGYFLLEWITNKPTNQVHTCKYTTAVLVIYIGNGGRKFVQWNSVITYPQGKWKRYVVTKVRSIQNPILLTGMTGSTCWRERSATEDASPFWMSFITRFSYSEIAFRGIVNLKTCREVEIKTERKWNTCSWSKKKEPKKWQKVLLEGKLVRNIRFCATFCTYYPKKMYMFSDWRCSWSTERTL